MTTADRAAAIRARLAAATPGPWKQDSALDPNVFGAADESGVPAYVGYLEVDDPDLVLLANAPADLAWCLDRIATLEAQRAELLPYAWVYGTVGMYLPGLWNRILDGEFGPPPED